MPGTSTRPAHFHKVLRVPGTGSNIYRDPLYNKGSAFSVGERDRLGIRGLVHPTIHPMDDQVERVMRNLRAKDTPISKCVGLHLSIIRALAPS